MIFAQEKSRIRFLIYTLMLFVCAVIQATPGTLPVQGVRPLLLIPLLVSIAAEESELCAAVCGMGAGLWWDWSAGGIFGSRAVFLVVCMTGVSLLCRYLFQAKLWNAALLCLIITSLEQAFQVLLAGEWKNFDIYYGLWQTGYTVVWIFLFAPVIRRISHFFELPVE